jgi:hypothetical protein
LVLGSEATSGAWLNGYTTTFDTFASTGPSSFTATTTGAKSPRVAVLASLPAAGWYWIEFTATFTGGSFSTVGVSNTGSPYSAAVATTVLPATGVAFRTLIYTSAAREYLTITFTASGASTLSVSGVSVKSYAGNHALQATSASRPILRARYNLLTYSEQLDNAAWAVTNASRSVGVTDPNGGTTAATITATAGNGYIRYAFSAGALSATNSIWIRRRTGTGIVYLNTPDNATAVAVSVTSSWQRFQVSSTGTIISLIVLIQTSGDAIDIAFPQMNYGSSAGTYQRIAAATDYATAGFLPYLALDGGDDWMASGSINFSATDKMSMCFGVTKLSDALVGMVTELSADYGTNAGSFYFAAPETTGASGDFSINARGSTSGARVSSIAAAPVTRVATGLIDIAAPSKTLRLNGSQVDANSASMGTGNFGNYPLYIGRRGGASLPFNGRIYQMVVCGKTLSASELASTEAYVATKTGVTL